MRPNLICQQAGTGAWLRSVTSLLIFPLLAVVVLTGGCAAASPSKQMGESVVFIGLEPAALAHPLLTNSLSVRSTFETGQGEVNYIEGRDFTVDYTNGTISRLPTSRLPDFQTNILFGKEDFDHKQFPGYGNTRFFAFVDYEFADSSRWPTQANQVEFLHRTQARLMRGQEVKIVAFGDSITAGYESTAPKMIFWNRWADALRNKYPRAKITVKNAATAGDATTAGLRRLQAKVLDHHPDLVLIGFGMNDHNKGGVPVPLFEENLKAMVAQIRGQSEAEVILYSTFPPNPKWRFGSHRMADYAAATARAARASGCAYADIFNNWQAVAARKKPEDLLGNDINHPNDFGHWIYYRVFSDLGL